MAKSKTNGKATRRTAPRTFADLGASDVRGLAPDSYVSPAVFEREVERIFRKEWLCVGRVQDVEKPGDYVSFELLGEPLMMVRDREGAVRVMSRVCQHRAMLVVEGAGNARSFVCPYHAWTYGLDGRLAGAPMMDKTPGFDPKSCRLPSPKMEIWEGFVFVNFDQNAKPLAPRWAGLSRFFKNYRLAEQVPVRSFEFTASWNWKVMCENFIEIYHHIGAHRVSLEPILPARLARAEPFEGPYAIMHSPHKEGVDASGWTGKEDEAHLPPIAGVSEEEARLTTFAHAFPCHLMSFFRDRTEYYLVFPEGPTRMRLRKVICVPPESLDHPDFERAINGIASQFLAFRQEDVEVNDAVMRGYRSRFAAVPVFSHTEAPLWQFANYLREKMGAKRRASRRA
jgi:phenylpropionate dioxygenase-like ring-hydroxylating dioxygenase large terminal subunit